MQPSKPLRSILKPSTIANKTSLHSILKDVKKAGADLPRAKQVSVAKIIKKLNDNPNAVVTNAMSKSAVSVLGVAGHLADRFQTNVGAAIAHVQNTTQTNSPGAPAASNAPAPSPAQARRLGAKEKFRMMALARERRRDAEEGKKVVRSLGLHEWQQASGSVEQMVKEKERERAEKQKKQEDSKHRAIDLMLD